MRLKIYDQFVNAKTKSGKPMSRQQRYIMRMRAEGRCRVCGAIANGVHCEKHQAMARERDRRRNQRLSEHRKDIKRRVTKHRYKWVKESVQNPQFVAAVIGVTLAPKEKRKDEKDLFRRKKVKTTNEQQRETPFWLKQP